MVIIEKIKLIIYKILNLHIYIRWGEKHKGSYTEPNTSGHLIYSLIHLCRSAYVISAWGRRSSVVLLDV